MRLLELRRQHLFRKSIYKRDFRFMKIHELKWLSKEELTEIRRVWPCFDIQKEDLIYSMMYKKVYGFNPYFINDYQLSTILKKTNPYNQVVSLAHKAMIDVYFEELPLPKVYLKRIANVFFDDKMKIMSFDQAIQTLQDRQQFVIKPTISTGCGKGVRIVRLDSNKNNKETIANLISSYGRDFVAQEILVQNSDISILNPTSVNSCRVTSIFLNGRFGCSTILKVGKQGAEVDNWNSGYLIGVNEDGTLRSFGFDNNLNKVDVTDNGLSFSGIKIPHYEDMIEFVKEYHPRYFPNCGIVGWDILIDSNDNVRVIEINLDYPGVVGEQLCSGTFFKDFRNEICELVGKSRN